MVFERKDTFSKFYMIFFSSFQPELPAEETATPEIVHEENDWGISLVSDDVPDQGAAAAAADTSGRKLVEGLQVSKESS